MSITKCMIAGLPGSGKSTYIGALLYCLMHPEKIEGIKFVADKMNLADDLTVLNRLSDAYKSMKRIDRNYSDKNETVQINLKMADSDVRLQVEVPDFLGENFRDFIELKESELVSEIETLENRHVIDNMTSNYSANSLNGIDNPDLNKLMVKLQEKLTSED